MRTTVVPAQITTVEDRIAGNLTFAQILLLIVPMLTGTATYMLIAPRVEFGALKLSFIGVQFLMFGLLALRVNGKIIGDWLIIFLRFFLRPRTYVFTKNDLTARDVVIVIHQKPVKQKKASNQPLTLPAPLSPLEKVQVDHLLGNPSVSVRFELAKKGGVDVSLTPIKQ